MPSKFYGIAAAGRPTIFIGSRSAKSPALPHDGCGFTVSPGDGEALVDRILELASDRGTLSDDGDARSRSLRAQWDKEKALARWEEVLMAAKTMK